MEVETDVKNGPSINQASETPEKHFQKSVVMVIGPPPSNEIKAIVANNKKQLEEVQARDEEIQTTSAFLK